MNRQVFRKEAIERLSSPEQLDLLMPVTSGRGWIALMGVGLLLLMGILWGVFGSVETTVEGTGLLMRYDGFQWVSAPQAGQVTDVVAAADGAVSEGDRLLSLSYTDADGSPRSADVLSPGSGRVLTVNVMEGSTVKAGEPLLSIESPEAPLQAAVYVSAADGFKVQPDMAVKLTPITLISESASRLPGRVESVARSPATQSQVMYTLQNAEWASTLMSRGPVLEVMINIPSEEPLTHLYSGTPCQASIVVAKRRPIMFLLPASGN